MEKAYIEKLSIEMPMLMRGIPRYNILMCFTEKTSVIIYIITIDFTLSGQWWIKWLEE